MSAKIILIYGNLVGLVPGPLGIVLSYEQSSSHEDCPVSCICYPAQLLGMLGFETILGCN